MMRRFIVMGPGALDQAWPLVLAEGVQWVEDGYVALLMLSSNGCPRATVLFGSIEEIAGHFPEPIELTWADAAPDPSRAQGPFPTVWEVHDDPEASAGLLDQLVPQ